VAYSFNDLFRVLRVSMRVNGIALGLLPGALCLLAPATFFLNRELTGDALWSVRLAGALLVAFGLGQLLHAADRIIELPVLLTTTVTNVLIGLILLTAYIRGDFAGMGLIGRIFLIFMVALALVGAVLPLRYLRAEYSV
jgi:hypothetical protein